MKEKHLKRKLRVELEIVPIEFNNDKVIEIIKEKFNNLLQELIKENLINMRHGASMTVCDVTPIEWLL